MGELQLPVGLAIASGVGSVVTGVAQAGAAKDAANAATGAANANLAFQTGVYNDAKGYLTPTINQGNQAGGVLGGLLGLGDTAASGRAWDTYRNSTNYNFLFDQGTKAVSTANAPSFNSGATAKALINYGQGMAGNALAGYEALLSGQQTLGANSAMGLSGIGQATAAQNAAARNSAASAQGGAALAGANAFGNAFSGVLGGANQIWGSSYGGNSALSGSPSGNYFTPGAGGSSGEIPY